MVVHMIHVCTHGVIDEWELYRRMGFGLGGAKWLLCTCVNWGEVIIFDKGVWGDNSQIFGRGLWGYISKKNSLRE